MADRNPFALEQPVQASIPRRRRCAVRSRVGFLDGVFFIAAAHVPHRHAIDAEQIARCY